MAPNRGSHPTHTHSATLTPVSTVNTYTNKPNPTPLIVMSENQNQNQPEQEPEPESEPDLTGGETAQYCHYFYVTREDIFLWRYNYLHDRGMVKDAARSNSCDAFLFQPSLHTRTNTLSSSEEDNAELENVDLASYEKLLSDTDTSQNGRDTPDPTKRSRLSSDSEHLARRMAQLKTGERPNSPRQRRDSTRSNEDSRRREEREGLRNKKRSLTLEPGQRTLLDLAGSQTNPPASPPPEPPASGGVGSSGLDSSPKPKPDSKPTSKNGRKKEKGKGKGKKRGNPGGPASAEGEGATSSSGHEKRPRKEAPRPPIPEVFVAGEATLSLRCTKPGAGAGASNDLMGTLFMAPETPADIVNTTPVPDGLAVEVTTEQSVVILTELLERAGWRVETSDIWPRYGFTAPAPLAGSGPNSPNLSPQDIVQGLILRNRPYGLPDGSLRYVSHNWETVVEGKGKGGPMRLRVYVDVSPEGVKYLERHNHFMKTLVYAVRLKPCPRGRR